VGRLTEPDPIVSGGNNWKKRAVQEDLDNPKNTLCGCGLYLDEGAKFLSNNLPIDPANVSPAQLANLQFQAAPDAAGDFCFMMNAVSEEANEPQIHANKWATTSKPLQITIFPVNDAPKIKPDNAAVVQKTATSGNRYYQFYDLYLEDVDAEEGAMTVQIQSSDPISDFFFNLDGSIYYTFNIDTSNKVLTLMVSSYFPSNYLY